MPENDQEKLKPTRIDINDTGLLTEEVALDPEGDAFLTPPPPPDAIYLAKLKLSGAAGQQWQAQPSREDPGKIGYLFCGIEARLIIGDGKPYDNAPVFDGYVSTMIMQSSGTCRVAGILRDGLRVKVPTRLKHKELAQLLNTALAGEPQVRIETRWEGYCDTCPGRRGKTGKVILRGMKKFPQRKAGAPHTHVVECSKCGTEVTAQARIVRYLPAKGGAQAKPDAASAAEVLA